MLCKIDHNDPTFLPKFLCVLCNPRAIDKPACAEWPPLEADAHAARMEKRQRRKLRAEVKRLRELADDIGGRDPKALARVETALTAAYAELALVS